MRSLNCFIACLTSVQAVSFHYTSMRLLKPRGDYFSEAAVYIVQEIDLKSELECFRWCNIHSDQCQAFGYNQETRKCCSLHVDQMRGFYACKFF